MHIFENFLSVKFRAGVFQISMEIETRDNQLLRTSAELNIKTQFRIFKYQNEVENQKKSITFEWL